MVEEIEAFQRFLKVDKQIRLQSWQPSSAKEHRKAGCIGIPLRLEPRDRAGSRYQQASVSGRVQI